MIQKGLKFYQGRSNAIILQETFPAYCIPKVVRLKTGEVLYEKVCMSLRLLPKISLVVDSNQDNTEIPVNPQEDQVPQTSIKVVAARSKAKAKPQQREPVDTPTFIPMH